MSTDQKSVVARSKAILDMGAMMRGPDGDDFDAFLVVVRGGPGSRNGTVVCGASMILDMPYEIIDGMKPEKPSRSGSMLHAVFGRQPHDWELVRLAGWLRDEAPGSMAVIPIDGVDQELQNARDVLAGCAGVIATCAFA